MTEYPKIESPFIGAISEANRKYELETFPLEVENRRIGYYEHLLPTTTIKEEEKKPGTIEKFTQFFKGSKKGEEFPVDFEPYTGHIASTGKVSEAQKEPIHSFVSIYSSGKSDEISSTKVLEYPKIEAPFTGYVPVAIKQELHPMPLEVERRHIGYNEHLPQLIEKDEKKPETMKKLILEPFIGHVTESKLNSELESLPLEVEKKHIGYYEQLPSIKVTEYPKIEELYVGYIHSLKPNEVESVLMEVEKKHIGFYENLPSTTIEEEKKPGTIEKITKLLKGSKTEGEFPVDSEPYIGPTTSTKIISELPKEPIHSLVSIYSSGHYDERPATKIAEYTKSGETFTGHIFEAKKQSELNNLPLNVEKKHIGYYEHLPITRDEEEKKPGALEKLTHLFKREESKDNYPQFTGKNTK